MNIRDKRGFRRTPTEEILRAEEEKQKELQSISSLPVAYVPTKSPEEYRKIAEEIAQKKQLHEEVKEETDGQKIEKQSKVQMSELRQAYPEVYAKIFAMKSRITSSDGWTNCASWTEIWVLMEGFEKINRTLNLILNQLEANKDELSALTTVLSMKQQEEGVENVAIPLRTNGMQTPVSKTSKIYDMVAPDPQPGDHTGETLPPDEKAHIPNTLTKKKKAKK